MIVMLYVIILLVHLHANVTKTSTAMDFTANKAKNVDLNLVARVTNNSAYGATKMFPWSAAAQVDFV